MVDRPGAPVCRNCGLPIARSGDPLRGVAPRWVEAPDAGPSTTTSLVGLALVLGLLLIGGALATSGVSILPRGGRLGVIPPSSPSMAAVASPGSTSRAPSVAAEMGLPGSEPTDAPIGEASVYTCEDAEIRSASKSRWRLQAVRAGSRRGLERVTFELTRRGTAKRAARVTIECMSPNEARRTFGLPRFDGQRGLLVTFRGPVSTTSTQLIGEVDLARQGMESISGIYRFVDFDGRVRTFIAIRDRACARLRAPQFADRGPDSRGARILLDLGAP